MASLAPLWASGVAVDWDGLPPHRAAPAGQPADLSLRAAAATGSARPTSPRAATHEPRDTADVVLPVGVAGRAAAGRRRKRPERLAGRRILVFDERAVSAPPSSDGCSSPGARPIVVRQRRARSSSIGDDEYVLDPARRRQLRAAGRRCVQRRQPRSPASSIAGAPSRRRRTDLDAAARSSLLAPDAARPTPSAPSPRCGRCPMLLVARGTDARPRRRSARPAAGARRRRGARCCRRSIPGLRVAHVDVDGDARVADQLVAELAAGAPEPAVALRDGQRFVESYEPVVIDSIGAAARSAGAPGVLVTGGLGHIGLNLAEAMFDRLGARLVLLGRSPLPEPRPVGGEGRGSGRLPPTARALLQRLAGLRSRARRRARARRRT